MTFFAAWMGTARRRELERDCARTRVLWALPLLCSWGGLAGCDGTLGEGEAADPSSSTGSSGGDGDEMGDGDGDGDTSGPDPACEESEIGEQPLRRLSSIQYHNTLRSLFGPELGPLVVQDSLFPETTINQGFHADAEANTVNTSESNAIEDNAERIFQIFSEDPQPFLEALLPCDVSAPVVDSDIDACMDSFIAEFGLRAYRRPLTTEEAAVVRSVYDVVAAEQDAVTGFGAALQLFVQAPALLYRVERGDGETNEGSVRLSSYEMATRLSYFLTDDMPDAELLDAASRDELRTVEDIRTQAERLADTEQFSATLARFLGDWLHLYDLVDLSKDPAVFPDFDDATRRALQEETARLLESVMSEGDGSLGTLLSTTTFPVHAATASLYGVDPPAIEWDLVDVPNRYGLFSQASFMSVLAEADRTSPIHRGATFVQDILCIDLPALPGDVDITGPLEDTSGLPTARERLAPLLESTSCSGCHQNFNPVGLAFENYDAVGAWRETENGAPIDASGSYNLGDGARDFEGPVEFLEMLSESALVRDCFSLQAFRAMKGRREFAEDACGIQTAQLAATQSGGDLREIVLSLVETSAFLHRRGTSE